MNDGKCAETRQNNVCINATSMRVLETILAAGKQQALNITGPCVCVCVCVCVFVCARVYVFVCNLALVIRQANRIFSASYDISPAACPAVPYIFHIIS